MRTLATMAALALAAGAALPAAAQETVTLVGYSGLFQERYTQAVIEPFMAAHPDIRVEYFPIQGSAQILGTLRAQSASPQSDIAIMDLSVAKTGTDEGLFDPVDESVSAHVAELDPRARADGVAGAGITFDNLVMLYNTGAVTEAPTSWNALKDPAYEGRVAMLGAPDLVGIGLTVILDHAAGGTDPIDNVDLGIEAMAEIAPNVQSWEPRPEVYPNVVNGQVWLGVGWNARSQLNADTSEGRLAVVLPEEGSVLQTNTINLVKNGPAGEAARVFVDYALSPEAQAAFTEAMYYAPTNLQAEISPEVSERTVVGSLDRMIDLDWIGLAAVRDQITQQWRRQVIPLSR
ncbi:ABC transporter substrate-binding protein [Aureimonas populi]|uniref:ABC transporter substrate-binding protein n=1 Tax=Aureimonas populi TaxID=1701758 RepID=A0ABW5CK99_9HYPH|nr:ABC transporter substrate-binding protein [Aureimonas populi]